VINSHLQLHPAVRTAAVRPAAARTTATRTEKVRATKLRVTLLRAALLVAAVGISVPSWWWRGGGLLPYRMDLDVYRLGGRAWLDGVSLYSSLPATAVGVKLPFTYPPFAAVVFSPLALIPLGLAGLLATLGTIAALIVPLRLYLRPLGWSAGWVLPAALLLEPVRSTIQFGQVNVVLMAMVAADCLVREPRWPRGLLTGVAAAVKLTPLPFILFFLLRRDYRAAATMGLSFAACTALGVVFAPDDSRQFWSSALFTTTTRIGNPQYAANQSFMGILARDGFNLTSPTCLCIWLALTVATLAVTCVGMRRALAARHARLALALNALAALLVSPISWSHHWVWAAPALLALVAAGRDRSLRGAWPAAGCGLVIFVLAPQWWFDSVPHWNLWQQALGDSYVIFAVSVLIAATRMRTWRTPPPATNVQVSRISLTDNAPRLEHSYRQ
jgi:alpha-1,2-mannosyltransferase